MAKSSKSIRRTIGANVATNRSRLGLSRPELAKRLGCDRTHLWRIERGLTRPSAALEDRMVALFKTTVDDLRRRPGA